MRSDERQRLIHLHTADLDKKPVGELRLGEIAIEHSGVKSSKIYIETDDTSVSANTLATFITEDAIKDYVEEEIEKASIYNERYKGVIDALPSADDDTVKIGDEYIVGTPFNIPANRSGDGVAKNTEKGDYILARTGGLNSIWDVRERNLEGAVVSTGMSENQIVVAETSSSVKSVAPSAIKVGSADTATDIDNAPVMDVADNDKVTVTVGTKTSAAFTVPFATSAASISLNGVQDADDLKAIEAISGTSGVLTKTDVNSWELGSYLSADTAYVESVEQTIDASGNTVTTFTMSDSSQETIVQALVIDCGEY